MLGIIWIIWGFRTHYVICTILPVLSTCASYIYIWTLEQETLEQENKQNNYLLVCSSIRNKNIILAPKMLTHS